MTTPFMRFAIDWDDDLFICRNVLKTDALNVMHNGISSDKGLVNLHWFGINKSLISGATADHKWNKLLDFYRRAAGEKLVLIDEVYKSEAATNTGNKALSMLLAKYDRIYADPFESVDVYT
jgi:glutaminase